MVVLSFQQTAKSRMNLRSRVVLFGSGIGNNVSIIKLCRRNIRIKLRSTVYS